MQGTVDICMVGLMDGKNGSVDGSVENIIGRMFFDRREGGRGTRPCLGLGSAQKNRARAVFDLDQCGSH